MLSLAPGRGAGYGSLPACRAGKRIASSSSGKDIVLFLRRSRTERYASRACTALSTRGEGSPGNHHLENIAKSVSESLSHSGHKSWPSLLKCFTMR